MQLSEEVKRLLLRLDETPKNFTGRIIFMSMFNDISCGSKDNEKECLANAKLVSLYARRFGLEKDNGHLLVLVPKRSDTVSVKTVHKEYGTILLKGCWWNSQKADVQCSVLRLHCPGQLKSKRRGKLSIHYAADQETFETIFRIIVSANQLSHYGAIAEICEEYESLHDRSGRPDMVMGQSSSSLVLSAIKTDVPLESDDPAYQKFLLQQCGERIEKLSQQDKLRKICMDAGFLSVVENGQCFMRKDTGDLTQFHAVACREYTLPIEDEASQPKGWIQGNTKIGPVLEAATSYLHGKHGVEIRIMSLSRDNTHSWVRISHGSNKFVMDLNNNDTEIPEDQLEEQALQLDAKDFVGRSKAKAKPQRR